MLKKGTAFCKTAECTSNYLPPPPSPLSVTPFPFCIFWGNYLDSIYMNLSPPLFYFWKNILRLFHKKKSKPIVILFVYNLGTFWGKNVMEKHFYKGEKVNIIQLFEVFILYTPRGLWWEFIACSLVGFYNDMHILLVGVRLDISVGYSD